MGYSADGLACHRMKEGEGDDSKERPNAESKYDMGGQRHDRREVGSNVGLMSSTAVVP